MKAKITVELISFLFTLLFVYAAAVKLMDHDRFVLQLGQSPLLSPYAGLVSIAVPLTELLLSALLLVPATRLIGFFGALSLMVMFTAYIIAILNFSSYIPCSCGGILEKLGWREHLVFNIAFILLALAAIVLLSATRLIGESSLPRSI
jgi:uncharacterized membrane protein YphA (DoxX/SURF4 family)